MNQIQGGRWEGLLSRFFNLKGPVAPGLAPEIMPTFPVSPFGEELYYLLGTRLLFGTTQAGPVAAQYSQVNIRNDSTDSLVIVEGCMAFDGSGATYFSLARGNNAVGVAVTVAGRDGRSGLTITAGSVAGVVRQSTAVAITGTVGFNIGVTAANETANFAPALPAILRPDDSLIVWNNVVNHSLFVSFCWRERVFELGENR